jgi:hypothetical protein
VIDEFQKDNPSQSKSDLRLDYGQYVSGSQNQGLEDLGSNLQNSTDIFLPAGKIGFMARKLRILSESAFYHVTLKGNLRGKVFFDDQDRRKFLEILRARRKNIPTFSMAIP